MICAAIVLKCSPGNRRTCLCMKCYCRGTSASLGFCNVLIFKTYEDDLSVKSLFDVSADRD